MTFSPVLLQLDCRLCTMLVPCRIPIQPLMRINAPGKNFPTTSKPMSLQNAAPLVLTNDRMQCMCREICHINHNHVTILSIIQSMPLASSSTGKTSLAYSSIPLYPPQSSRASLVSFWALPSVLVVEKSNSGPGK